jgi:hypothetical protein
MHDVKFASRKIVNHVVCYYALTIKFSCKFGVGLIG